MTELDFRRIVGKWASLRRFAGLTVECALESVNQGKVDVATFFSKLLYFLPYSPRSLEKVLSYGLIKVSHGYVKKDTSFYTLRVNEIPFSSEDESSVRMAFESLVELGITDIVDKDTISFRSNIVNDIVKHIAPFIIGKIQPADIALEAASYPYKVISGISSLYVMVRSNKLPRCYTVLAGLVSPVVKIDNGTSLAKSTIEVDEWNEATKRMSQIKMLKNIFVMEYFKALGFMFGNNIVVRTYPIEVSGFFIENVIKPAYQRYYILLRRRSRGRGT